MDKKEKKIAIIAALIIIVILASSIILLLNPDLFSGDNSTNQKYNTYTFEVSDGADDARTFTIINNPRGYQNEDGKNIPLQLSPSYSFGVRFTNVTLPENETIQDAYIELYSICSTYTKYPNCYIYADTNKNSSNFTKDIGVLDVSGRNYTNHSIIWNTTLPHAQWVKTPSLKDIIYEVVNNKNWTEGDPITVLFVTRAYQGYAATFKCFEKGYPARLIIKTTN